MVAPLLVEKRDSVLRLTLNRPEKLNAINLELADLLLYELSQANKKSDIRVVVLCGEGRAFCSGKDTDEPASSEYLEIIQGISKEMVCSSKLFITAAQGWAIGLGLEWVVNADFSLFAADVKCKYPAIKNGLFATGGITTLLPKICGLAKAKEILLLGHEFSALEAKALGVTWKVVATDSLLRETIGLAQELSEISPHLSASLKKIANSTYLNDFTHGIESESEVIRALPYPT